MLDELLRLLLLYIVHVMLLCQQWTIDYGSFLKTFLSIKFMRYFYVPEGIVRPAVRPCSRGGIYWLLCELDMVLLGTK